MMEGEKLTMVRWRGVFW